jgi:hypothetical protein
VKKEEMQEFEKFLENQSKTYLGSTKLGDRGPRVSDTLTLVTRDKEINIIETPD